MTTIKPWLSRRALPWAVKLRKSSATEHLLQATVAGRRICAPYMYWGAISRLHEQLCDWMDRHLIERCQVAGRNHAYLLAETMINGYLNKRAL